MQDVIFVVNPSAASGRAGRVWHQLCDQISPLRGMRCVTAQDPSEARRALLDLLDERVRRVVAVGGDGTLNHVANVLLESGHAAALGLVPVGSGSDMARGLRLERAPALALERALERAPRPVDAIRYRRASGEGWVVNIASIGVSGLVAEQVNTLSRRWAGTYLWTALKALSRYRPFSCRVHVDGQLWFEGPVLLLAVANGGVFARGMRIAPQARSDDGWADVVLVRAAPLVRVLPWVPRLYTGGHLRAPFISQVRARAVRVEPLDAAAPPFETDGEAMAGLPTEFTLVPGALKLAH